MECCTGNSTIEKKEPTERSAISAYCTHASDTRLRPVFSLRHIFASIICTLYKRKADTNCFQHYCFEQTVNQQDDHSSIHHHSKEKWHVPCRQLVIVVVVIIVFTLGRRIVVATIIIGTLAVRKLQTTRSSPSLSPEKKQARGGGML